MNKAVDSLRSASGLVGEFMKSVANNVGRTVGDTELSDTGRLLEAFLEFESMVFDSVERIRKDIEKELDKCRSDLSERQRQTTSALMSARRNGKNHFEDFNVGDMVLVRTRYDIYDAAVKCEIVKINEKSVRVVPVGEYLHAVIDGQPCHDGTIKVRRDSLLGKDSA